MGDSAGTEEAYRRFLTLHGFSTETARWPKVETWEPCAWRWATRTSRQRCTMPPLPRPHERRTQPAASILLDDY